MRRIALGTAIVGVAAASLLTTGVGTASAASAAYCYRNLSNDNGTRVALRDLFVSDIPGEFITVSATAVLERYDGARGYVFQGPSVTVRSSSVQAAPSDANAICNTITSRAGFSGYRFGNFG